MTGRPDYDAGDLVVCVEVKNPHYGFQVGRAYRATYVGNARGIWFVVIEGKQAPSGIGWIAHAFRRIDPKPPEFFAGKIETVREDELV